MVGAHPDDENTTLIAYLTAGRKMRTGYLSLTRGEGGQNLLGPEQGELLGVLRTQELMAARRIDGAEQYFTRAIDFGYSKSAAATFARWPREEVLADIVWVIRRFRPDILIQVFTGTAADGHGHHQASGQLATEAFRAAASAERFAEQLTRVKPWQATRLLQGCLETDLDVACFRIDAGEAAPHGGLSYGEIALASRGMHRTQGMHTPGRRAPGGSLRFLEGKPVDRDIFDGIDTTWGRVPGGDEAGRLLACAVEAYGAGEPAEALELLLRARPVLADLSDPWAAVKRRDLDEAIARLAGVPRRVVADRWLATPGSTLRAGIRALDQIVTITVPPDQPYSQPYWLRRPHDPYFYDVPEPELLGSAESPAALTATFHVTVAGREVEFTEPLVSPGERPSPVAVVPRVSLRFEQEIVLFPALESKEVTVRASAIAGEAKGEVRLEAPEGWRAWPTARPFRLAEGEQAALAFTISPPECVSAAAITAAAVVEGGEYRNELAVVGYPCLARQAVLRPASARLVRADVQVSAKRIGYIAGAGDKAPEALAQLGCQVTMLTAGELARGDLDRFDAIVTGVRAFNVRADLRANKSRLLGYVERGGVWIVQYNVRDRRAPEAVADIGPYPLTVGTARVTGADAPVALLDPAHPLLNAPNRIGEEDFLGWVQERGLYFAAEWDARYTPLTECRDPGEEPQRGALLYARYGGGVYIFTAFSWFRQLPAGVPGAYRIFANLLSAGRR